jgi:hypothetical protein
MQRPIGLALGPAIGLAALTLVACQKAAAPPAAAANVAPAAANVAASAPAGPPATAAPASPDAAAVEAFLDGVYAHYKSSDSGGVTWSPLDAKVFDADLVKLMAADTKALKGEVGVMDGDWLCDCQDWGSIAATVTVSSASPTEAKAVAVFQDTQIKDAAASRNAFDLVKTPDGWRIHDMGTTSDPSLRGALTKEIADLKSGKPADDAD